MKERYKRMNNFTFSGRFTKDFTQELKTSQNGSMFLFFVVAIQQDKEKVVFMPCMAYGAQAEYIAKRAYKGKEIVGSGTLAANVNQDGSMNGVKCNVNQAMIFESRVRVDEGQIPDVPVEENPDPWDR